MPNIVTARERAKSCEREHKRELSTGFLREIDDIQPYEEVQCSTVAAWSKPGLDPCEIKKKGLPFQLKFINCSQALSNMKGHRIHF